MRAFWIFAICLTVAYIIYYAVTIVRDLYGKPGEKKSDEETFEVASSDDEQEEANVSVAESKTGFSIGDETFETSIAPDESADGEESEAADIKSVMQEYGKTTEQQKAVGAWLCDYAELRQPFDEIKHRHTLKEVGDVAEGAYDWKIKRGLGEVSL